MTVHYLREMEGVIVHALHNYGQDLKYRVSVPE